MAHTFRVWAPTAERTVDVELHGQLLPLAREGELGWWRRAEPGAAVGDTYRFVLDGGEALADPRSRSQPGGVHGPSAVVDVAGFPWTDAGWRGVELEDLTVYELHVGTFTSAGTLDGAIERLDHLVDLGVGAIELMPVNDFPGDRGWGYDGVHLFAVHRTYGGPDALCRFVDAAHGRGLAVILDVVYNHVGPDGAVLDRYGPYTTQRYRTPWGGALNLDGAGSDQVRAFIVENALMWLHEHHLDGLRLDAVHAVVDTSAVHILEELRARVADLEGRLGRRLLVIAESDLNDPRLVRAVGVGGYGLDAQWSDDFHHALWVALTGERNGYYADFGGFDDLARAVTRGVVYDGRYSVSRQRRHGRPFLGVPGQRLLGYLQDHDQVGNRPAGDRSSARLSTEELMAAAATVILAPFTPILFMGEEWGASTPWQYFTDHRDPELAAAVSRGRRSEFRSFGWRDEDVPDPQDPATFERSRLRWSEVGKEPHRRLLAWHRDLLRLRRERPEMRDAPWDGENGYAGVSVTVDAVARTLTMRRGRLVVAWNLGPAPARLRLDTGSAPEVILSSEHGWSPAAGGAEMAAGMTAVLEIGGARSSMGGAE